MPETSLVARIRKLAAAQRINPRIVKGIGDDCAVVRPRPGEDLVFTSDYALEGRHFDLITHSAADVGHKALARSLSDLAAMGSTPVFCLVSLGLPKHLGQKWMNGFYHGLLRLADKASVSLAGGDLSSFPQVIADVTCCGRVPRNRALLRSVATPGDFIYVTGQLGASANGFRLGPGSHYWRHHLRPQPRLAAGFRLQQLGVHACMDLSDGLSLDLHRLCSESGVSAELATALPVAPGATIQDALHGGEDYELLFTAPPVRRIPSTFDKLLVTRIGIITKGRPGVVHWEGRKLKPGGFDHFS